MIESKNFALVSAEMKRLLLFDFDGVVVDSLEFYEASVNLCLEKIGEPRLESRSDFLELFDDNFYAGIMRRGIDQKAFTEATVQVAPYLNFGSISLYGEVVQVIEALKKDHNLSLISSNSAHAIRHIFEKVDFYFEHVLGFEFMFSKIEKIRHETKRTGISAESTYYIGDTLGDILEAKAAGVKTVAVTWGWHPKERLVTGNPDYVVDSPREILKLFTNKF